MKRYFLLLVLLMASVSISMAQIPKPSETFGFEPGADYKMATYDQMLDTLIRTGA